MISNIFFQLHSLLLKDYGILKLIFTCVASYLIFDAIYTFAVLKPTYTSHEERQLSFDDFPEILICPEPSIDLNALRVNDYDLYQFYFGGSIGRHGSSLVKSWAGNNSKDVQIVADSISTLKSEKDCPDGVLRTKDGSSEAAFTIVKALNPYHACCKVEAPKFSHSHPIQFLRIFFPKQKRDKCESYNW